MTLLPKSLSKRDPTFWSPSFEQNIPSHQYREFSRRTFISIFLLFALACALMCTYTKRCLEAARSMNRYRPLVKSPESKSVRICMEQYIQYYVHGVMNPQIHKSNLHTTWDWLHLGSQNTRYTLNFITFAWSKMLEHLRFWITHTHPNCTVKEDHRFNQALYCVRWMSSSSFENTDIHTHITRCRTKVMKFNTPPKYFYSFIICIETTNNWAHRR